MKPFPSLLKRASQRSDELDKEKLAEVEINGMECIAVGQVCRVALAGKRERGYSVSENKIRPR